jgi:hypothetical protein
MINNKNKILIGGLGGGTCQEKVAQAAEAHYRHI